VLNRPMRRPGGLRGWGAMKGGARGSESGGVGAMAAEPVGGLG
jgi:hypothetical protein